jgi:hypothetical protein
MKFKYYSFKAISTPVGADTNDMQQLMQAGEAVLYCVLHFDTDEASETYGKWIMTLDVVSDTENYPERSLVLYPNTLHFKGDSLYTVAVTSELESIGHDDLPSVMITVGVVDNE